MQWFSVSGQLERVNKRSTSNIFLKFADKQDEPVLTRSQGGLYEYCLHDLHKFA